jgi:hypothetical protein
LKNFGPTAQLAWLRQALTDLGLDTGPLAAAQKAADVATGMDRRMHERQAAAARRRQDAVAKLTDKPDGSFDVAVEAYMAESAWLDIEGGHQQPPALELLRGVRRQVESRVGGALMGAGPRIFDMVKAKAAEVVAEVAALPKFPEIWTMSNAAGELSKYRAHRASWGTLVAADQDFRTCHLIGDVYRDFLGLSQDQLDGPPPWSLVYRNWRPILDDQTWPQVRKELKLPYAIQHRFEPGLWEPSEIDVTAQDKSFGARLRNLGSAVLAGSS